MDSSNGLVDLLRRRPGFAVAAVAIVLVIALICLFTSMATDMNQHPTTTQSSQHTTRLAVFQGN